MCRIIQLYLFFQDLIDASEEQALNSSNFDGSNDLIELSDDDEFDEVMAEVIIKLCGILKLCLCRDSNHCQWKTFLVFC